MFQTTIAKSVEILGIGIHTGESIHMRLDPANADEGITFYRSDLGNRPIKAHSSHVVKTTMATTIGDGEVSISTIEHLISAVYAYGIDNMKIFIDNIETPILDGSSQGFCCLLNEAQIKQLSAPKKILKITKEIEVRSDDNKSFARLTPSKKSTFDYTIDFKHPAISRQSHSFELTKTNYIENISKARTFGFLSDLHYLQSKGLAKGGDMSNAIALDEDGILNPEGLRYDTEFVRHKILDAIGDLSLLGSFVLGAYTSFAGSHKLNHELCQEVLKQNAYEIISANVTDFHHVQNLQANNVCFT